MIARAHEEPKEKRAIDEGGMTGVYTFDEALAEIQRLGRVCEAYYAELQALKQRPSGNHIEQIGRRS